MLYFVLYDSSPSYAALMSPRSIPPPFDHTPSLSSLTLLPGNASSLKSRHLCNPILPYAAPMYPRSLPPPHPFLLEPHAWQCPLNAQSSFVRSFAFPCRTHVSQIPPPLLRSDPHTLSLSSHRLPPDNASSLESRHLCDPTVSYAVLMSPRFSPPPPTTTPLPS